MTVVARALIDAFRAGDWARFRATIAPEVAYEETGTGRRIDEVDAYVASARAGATPSPTLQARSSRRGGRIDRRAGGALAGDADRAIAGGGRGDPRLGAARLGMAQKRPPATPDERRGRAVTGSSRTRATGDSDGITCRCPRAGAEPAATPARDGGALGLLGRRAPFRRLWAARVVSSLGDALGLVALILLVAERAGTGLAIGLLLLASDFTPTVASPLIGALADRLDRRRVLVACELAQGLIVGAIALTAPPLALLLPLVAARAILAATFQAAARSAVPDLVADEDLEAANALLGFGTHGLEVAGPLLATLLLPALGVRGLLALDAATFLAATPCLLALPALSPSGRTANPGAHLLADAGAGLRALWSAPVARVVAAGFCGLVLSTAVDDVALVLLGRRTFGASAAATSALYAGSGLGLLVGFGALARLGPRVRPGALFLIGLAVASAGNLATGLAPALAAAFALQVVRGCGGSMLDVGSSTLLQRAVPPHLRARVFANLYGGIGLAAGISYLAGGLLLDRLSAPTVLVLAGGGGLLVAAATALPLARALGRSPEANMPR
jgi:MFS family permease